jgi:hypothetical protein
VLANTFDVAHNLGVLKYQSLVSQLPIELIGLFEKLQIHLAEPELEWARRSLSQPRTGNEKRQHQQCRKFPYCAEMLAMPRTRGSPPSVREQVLLPARPRRK